MIIAPVSQNITNSSRLNKGVDQPNFGKRFLEPGDKLTDAIAHGFAKLSKTKLAQSTIEGMAASFTKPAARMMDLASAVYTLSMLKSTASSKKIKKERKPMLLINAVLVTVVSSTMAFIVDKVTDPLMEKMKDAYKAFQKPNANWLSDKDFAHGIDKMKSLSIFALVVRFVVPLIMVPVTGGIVKKLKANADAKVQQQKAVEQNKTQVTPEFKAKV